MLTALAGLARRLQTVVELRQKVTDAPLADFVALFGQLLRQPRRALAGPSQRRLRVASGRRLNQPVKVTQKCRILVDQLLAPAALDADPALAGAADRGRRERCQRRRRRSQFLQTGIDRRSRYADGLRHRAHPTPTKSARLNSRPQTQRRLVQATRQHPVLVRDRPSITHDQTVRVSELFKLLL